MDRIIINDLRVAGIIGVFPAERQAPQELIISLVLHTDIRRPGHSDDLGDAVDYKVLKDEVVALVRDSRYLLLEKLATAIATVALADRRIEQVTVRVEKPAALPDARTVAIEIERSQADMR